MDFLRKMAKAQDTAFGIFINHVVRAFRSYDENTYTITISGIGKFISENDKSLFYMLEQLEEYQFIIQFTGEQNDINNICVDYTKGDGESFSYQVGYIPSISELSYRIGLSTPCILIMRIVARVISIQRTLYKAFVLDLDDTLWKGTLSEDGPEKIEKNLQSDEGRPFIDFMNFIKHIAGDLGLFVAICSRNDMEEVKNTIDRLDESIFPLKGQIDCIVANNNSKSENLGLIVKQLSILPEAIVFIDDNEIVRDDIKKNYPKVFVPEWKNHYNLINAIIGSCMFDRSELSISAQNRRRILKVIHADKMQNPLPRYGVKINDDIDHTEAQRLYTKSNQFRFSRNTDLADENCKSTYFEAYRENGEKLDTAAAISYLWQDNHLIISNFAMSCKYFEIGLEEFILLVICNMANGKKVLFEYQDTGKNKKVQDLFERYPDAFAPYADSAFIEFNTSADLRDKLKTNTRLEQI